MNIVTAIALTLLLFIANAFAQDGVERRLVPVLGAGGAIQQDVMNGLNVGLGSIDRRNQLAGERRDTIERLTAELSRCGNCADRQRIAGDLEYWKAQNALILEAERIALQSSGISKYKSFQEFRAGFSDYLEHYNTVTPAQQAKRALDESASAAQGYCGQIMLQAHENNARTSPAFAKCMSENEPHDMVLQEQIAYSYCSNVFQDGRRKGLSSTVSGFYWSECLTWNVPRRRLTFLFRRFQLAAFAPGGDTRDTVADWCKAAGGMPETVDPVTKQIDPVKSREYAAAMRACVAKFNYADLQRQRDQAEPNCAGASANDFSRRSFEVVDCLYHKDPVRRLSLEAAEARDQANKPAVAVPASAEAPSALCTRLTANIDKIDVRVTMSPCTQAATAATATPQDHFNLGKVYIANNQVSLAFKETQQAAESGYAAAQVQVGSMYHRGYGVPQDLVKAIEWFKKGASQGHPAALYKLATSYKQGEGVNVDHRLAAEYASKSADAGYADAEAMLGELYWNGQGVPQDKALARRWIEKSIADGSEDGKALRKQMSF